MGPPDLPACDDRRMWDVMMSVYHFPALTAADELGVFAVLASLGLLERHGERFGVTEVARTCLIPSSPFYWGGMLRFIRDLPFTRRSVQHAPKVHDGRDIWETHETDPDLARAMAHRCDLAGFRDVRATPTHGYSSVVTAFKPAP